MRDAGILARVLADPAVALTLDGAGWTALISIARAEHLAGTLAHRVGGLLHAPPQGGGGAEGDGGGGLQDRTDRLPPPPSGFACHPPLAGEDFAAVAAILAEARGNAEQARRTALWEAEMVARALTPVGCPVVLLKGTAFAAAGLAPARGRSIGDCDILVPRDALDAVEAALFCAGWEWVKPDAYDDAYYRRWMHELPPLIHRERDRMVDVHHTILPPTARPTPDAAAIVADSILLGNGLRVPCAEDLIVHAAAHLIADGDLTGGLRNLWDIHCLLDGQDLAALADRAAMHGLLPQVHRAVRLSHAMFGTGIPGDWRTPRSSDALFRRRLLARNGWGQGTRPATRLAFYVRSHAMRMPPGLLARHLWTKWRKG